MAWAKLKGDRQLPLAHHCADVACVFRRLVARPVTRARLAYAAGQALIEDVTLDRLAVLSFLHDFGKANHGFQARFDPKAPPIGHLRQTRWLFNMDNPDGVKALKAAGFLDLQGFPDNTASEFLEALLAHHGKPVAQQVTAGDRDLWLPKNGIDPVDALKDLGQAARAMFPKAFVEGGETVPDNPAFIHAFAGLLNLADWIGSDERFFPVIDEGQRRFSRAWVQADLALGQIGALAASSWWGMDADQAAFSRAFGGYTPRPFQQVVANSPGLLVAAEAETGAGKTEAALWRFLRFAAAGDVDGLYFALPTRVAARQLHARVEAMVKSLWPENPPLVVLATPGEIDSATAHSLSSPVTERKISLYDADNDAMPPLLVDTARLWASERPKRYLAAPIAVGTIDQALLSIIRTKHSHLRASGLLGKLLVIDEVHASDVYMTRLTLDLLHRHHAIGGHALLLSATLGATARAALLTGPGTATLRGKDPPSLEEAIALPYPSVSRAEFGSEKLEAAGGSGRTKTVTLTLLPLLDDPARIASQAIAAAKARARVLVVRNTVDAAVAVFELVRANVLGDDPILFRVNGVATLHHGRFSREDRAIMDSAVDSVLGQHAPRPHGLVLIGTQTLEQSLDIDADLLITDLCPADVLLQRIGRLHRHDRSRPAGFEHARTIILGPKSEDMTPFLDRAAHGLGMFRHRGIPQGGVYENLLAVEATRRLIVSKPVWTIPEMNRELVEKITHPVALGVLLEELAAKEPKWREHADDNFGLSIAHKGAAAAAVVDWTKPFSELLGLSWSGEEERLTTRLGLDSRVVEFDDGTAPLGPFGVRVRRISIPGRWTGQIDPAVAEPWRSRPL
jgi:CRISPR-associated endonuclease/helicase Cas3